MLALDNDVLSYLFKHISTSGIFCLRLTCKYLNEKSPKLTHLDVFDDSIRIDDLLFFDYIKNIIGTKSNTYIDIANIAASYGSLNLFHLFTYDNTENYKNYSDIAMKHGQIPILKWIKDTNKKCIFKPSIAIQEGQVDCLKWLLSNGIEITEDDIGYVSDINMLDYLHEYHRSVLNVRKLLAEASTNNNVNVLEWCLEKDYESIIDEVAPSMSWNAIKNGSIDILNFLYDRYPRRWNVVGIYKKAIEFGKLKSLKWMYEKSGIPICDVSIAKENEFLNEAIRYKHLNIIEYICDITPGLKINLEFVVNLYNYAEDYMIKVIIKHGISGNISSNR